MKIEEIANEREIAKETVVKHLMEAGKKGKELDWSIFVSPDNEQKILAIYKKREEPRLSELKEALPEEYTYEEIRAALIKNGKL